MRVNINYTVDVDKAFRKAIRLHYGEDRLATREEIVQWFRQYGESMNDDLSGTIDTLDISTNET